MNLDPSLNLVLRLKADPSMNLDPTLNPDLRLNQDPRDPSLNPEPSKNQDRTVLELSFNCSILNEFCLVNVLLFVPIVLAIHEQYPIFYSTRSTE